MSTVIAKAKTLLIEAGAMSGGARNQMELTDYLIQFFDAAARNAQSCDIRLPNGRMAIGRPASHRGHRYGQWADIWRLGLPTAAKGGPRYPGTLIRLDKVKQGSGFVYELTLTSPKSILAKQWKSEARTKGRVGATRGPKGRAYGYW